MSWKLEVILENHKQNYNALLYEKHNMLNTLYLKIIT